MPVYKGKINARQFATLLNTILVDAGYTEISSNKSTDGFVYKSMGESGTDEFYVRIFDPNSNRLKVSIAEKYKPNTVLGIEGTFTNYYDTDCITWNTTIGDARLEIQYVININKDRIIIFVSGNPAEANYCKSLSYIGLPKRYDPNDKGAGFAGITGTTRMPWNNEQNWVALRNRAQSTIFAYNTAAYIPAKAVGWNNQLFFSPIIIGSSAEGPRGELDGLYQIKSIDENNEVLHGDTFTQGGKTYMIIEVNPVYNSTETLSQVYDYVIEV